MTTNVDDRGRILLPKALRDAHGLTPGSPVIIESTAEGIRLRAALRKEEALARLAGAINDDTRAPSAAPQDPLQVKRMWEPLP